MFYDEVLGQFSGEIPNFFGIFSDNFLNIQGNFKLEYYSTVKIILSFKKQKVFVYGQNLSLKEMDKNQLLISGQIVSISTKEVLIA